MSKNLREVIWRFFFIANTIFWFSADKSAHTTKNKKNNDKEDVSELDHLLKTN